MSELTNREISEASETALYDRVCAIDPHSNEAKAIYAEFASRGVAFAPYGNHLPVFPLLTAPVTEDKLERTVERLFDRADSALMSGHATQAEYDRWSRRCDAWANGYRVFA